MNEVIAGIDIGSSKVCAVLGELDKKNQLEVFGVGTAECKGLKKGLIVDIDNTAEAIKSAVEQAERMSGIEIKSAFINIAGGHATLIKNKGVIAVSREDREITSEDVKRVLETVRIVNMPIDREIIGVIPIQFIVDGYEHIKDPVGMVGMRLEADAYIITAPTASVQNLIRSVERCGIKVSGIILDPFAAGEIVLTKDEKELGVALVDVGGETTDISIYSSGNMVYTKLVPIGGVHITNDISIGLKIPLSEAETLKRQYGCASLAMLKSDEDIPLNSASSGQMRKISTKELIDIVEARVQEIYDIINHELESSGYKDSIPAGLVITGGGVSFIKGTLEVAASTIGLPVRIGSPKYIGVASPVYATGTGIVKYVLSSRKVGILNKSIENEEDRDDIARHKKSSDKIVSKIKDFFIDFF